MCARRSLSTCQLVELKNGETYNGELVGCDNWMNIRCAPIQSHLALVLSPLVLSPLPAPARHAFLAMRARVLGIAACAA